MKTIITFLVFTVAGFAATHAATLNATNTSSTDRVEITTEEQGDSFEASLVTSSPKSLAPVDDQTILNPELALGLGYQKTIEKVIAENNEIIESTANTTGSYEIGERSVEEVIQIDNQIIDSEPNAEIHALSFDQSIEDRIAEDNAIIESTIDKQIHPLNIHYINQKSMSFSKPLLN